MAVDQVVFVAFRRRKRQYAGGKLVQVGFHLLHGNQAVGPGRNVNDPAVGTQLVVDQGLTPRLQARKDVYLHAGIRQGLAEIAHVDVHPTRLLPSQLGQRAGMVAEHCHAAGQIF